MINIPLWQRLSQLLSDSASPKESISKLVLIILSLPTKHLRRHGGQAGDSSQFKALNQLQASTSRGLQPRPRTTSTRWPSQLALPAPLPRWPPRQPSQRSRPTRPRGESRQGSAPTPSGSHLKKSPRRPARPTPSCHGGRPRAPSGSPNLRVNPADLSRIISKLDRGKSPGPSGWTAELIFPSSTTLSAWQESPRSQRPSSMATSPAPPRMPSPLLLSSQEPSRLVFAPLQRGRSSRDRLCLRTQDPLQGGTTGGGRPHPNGGRRAGWGGNHPSPSTNNTRSRSSDAGRCRFLSSWHHQWIQRHQPLPHPTNFSSTTLCNRSGASPIGLTAHPLSWSPIRVIVPSPVSFLSKVSDKATSSRASFSPLASVMSSSAVVIRSLPSPGPTLTTSVLSATSRTPCASLVAFALSSPRLPSKPSAPRSSGRTTRPPDPPKNYLINATPSTRIMLWLKQIPGRPNRPQCRAHF